MKKLLLVSFLVASLGFLTTPVGAITLLSTDFTGVTIYDNLTINLINNPPPGPDDNLGKWIDFPNTQRWGISNSGGVGNSAFAQHLPQTSDQTNLLFYGIDLGAIPPLTTFSLDFDYIFTNTSAERRVVLAGMYNGVNALDPFAPWFSSESVPPETPDGIPFVSNQLAQTASWTHVHIEGVVPQDFDVLALGFIMGGIEGTRGVDNVVLNAEPVPEPGTMILLGSGLVGLWGLRRKFWK